MCACFLRICVFQMLKENDSVANLNNENFFFVQTIKHWKNKGYKDSLEKIGKSWFIERMIICGRFLRKRRKEGSF